tara:strand:+ start:582 stop:2432 length:1851 start_codon:yes stop_codon:yes gene_type:complete
MTTTNITDLANSSTFENWKTKTNELIAHAAIGATLGDSQTNAGNLKLTGNLVFTSASNSITVDNISTISGTAVLKLNDAINVKGDITLNNKSATPTATKIQFAKGSSSDTLTCYVSTNADHTKLELGIGSKKLILDSTSDRITSEGGLLIDSAMLQNSLNGIAIGATTAAAGSFTDLVAVGTGSSSINNVVIGDTNPTTAVFTTVVATTGLVIGTTANGFSGSIFCNDIKGRMMNTDGSVVVVDAGASTAVFRGNLIGDVTGNVTGNITAGTLSSDLKVELVKMMYPVGAIFTSGTSTNPATSLLPAGANAGSVGVWAKFSQGRTLMGAHDIIDFHSDTTATSSVTSDGRTLTLHMQGNTPVSVGEKVQIHHARYGTSGGAVPAWTYDSTPSQTGTAGTIQGITRNQGGSGNTILTIFFDVTPISLGGTTAVVKNSQFAHIHLMLERNRDVDSLAVLGNEFNYHTSAGGESGTVLQNNQINHMHVTGSFIENTNDDWLPLTGNTVIATTSKPQDDVMWHNFETTRNGNSGTGHPHGIDELSTASNLRWVAGEGNSKTYPDNNSSRQYSNYFGTDTPNERQRTTITTGIQKQMMDKNNVMVGSIPPHETVYMWIRTA